jgi:hypothetical protein
MFSTRNFAFLFVVIGLSLAGCQRIATYPPQAGGTVGPADSIEQTRADWPQSTVYPANGDVVAGSTGLLYEPSPQRPEWVQGLMDVPVFLGNTVLMPFTLIFTPLQQTHTGVQYEPTMTAVPTNN